MYLLPKKTIYLRYTPVIKSIPMFLQINSDDDSYLPDMKIAISMNTKYPEYGRLISDDTDKESVADLHIYHVQNEYKKKVQANFGKKEHDELEAFLRKQTSKQSFAQLMAERMANQKYPHIYIAIWSDCHVPLLVNMTTKKHHHHSHKRKVTPEKPKFDPEELNQYWDQCHKKKLAKGQSRHQRLQVERARIMK